MLLNSNAREVIAKLEHQSAQKHSYKGIISYFSVKKLWSIHQLQDINKTCQGQAIILMALECHSQCAMLMIINNSKINECISCNLCALIVYVRALL